MNNLLKMSDLRYENKTVTLTCPKHGEYTGEVVKVIFLEREKEINPVCPFCEQERAAEKAREEEEYQKRLTTSRLRSMNVEPRFYESTLDNFNAYNAELRGHLETCRRFAEHPDGKLVMLGAYGNGKTHLAVSVLKAVGGVMYTATEIALRLRQSYNGGVLKEWEIFEELCTAPLLVIDEVEKIKETEWKGHWMSHIVGKRYNRFLPIIFISNCHLQIDCPEREQPCPHCLEYHLDNDVLSRILEDGIMMNFTSGDYRIKIRNARLGSKAIQTERDSSRG
jgi:DNA replication protein DnaC